MADDLKQVSALSPFTAPPQTATPPVAVPATPPDPRPALPNVPALDFSNVRSDPKMNCQQDALHAESRLKSMGYQTRLAEVIIQDDPHLAWDQRLHYVVLYKKPKDDTLYMADKRYGGDAAKWSDARYIPMALEK